MSRVRRYLCYYCRRGVVDALDATCPECGAHLTERVTGRHTIKRLVELAFANGYRLEVPKLVPNGTPGAVDPRPEDMLVPDPRPVEVFRSGDGFAARVTHPDRGRGTDALTAHGFDDAGDAREAGLAIADLKYSGGGDDAP